MVYGDNPQLLFLQHTRVSIYKKEETCKCAHTHTHFYLNFPKIDFTAQTREWKDKFQHDPASLQELHVDLSLMLQMFFQFKSNQNIFSPTLLLFHLGQIWFIETEEEGREEREAPNRSKSDIQFSNDILSPSVRDCIFLPAGSIATTSMNMFWAIFSILLANLRWENPGRPINCLWGLQLSL